MANMANMANKSFINPRFEARINRAVFINQDLVVYPDRGKGLPDNFENVIKFLFGAGAHIRQDVTNGYPSFTIKGASYGLRNVSTINADWTYHEVKE